MTKELEVLEALADLRVQEVAVAEVLVVLALTSPLIQSSVVLVDLVKFLFMYDKGVI
jgi:hypothetical protein